MPRFLHAFRSKDKEGEALSTGASSDSKSRSKQESSRFRNNTWVPPGYHRGTGFLPEKALERIFHFVCPHSSDDKYRTPEESAGAIGDGCILCDTRDLASCMRVNRTWYRAAEKKLYKSIRFETVHYCEREDWLREYRKHKHKPEEVDQLRLRLLEKTLGEFQTAAMTVQLLKFPYQIREGYKADLARIVTHTPNLRYVDLPEGIFSDQQSCMILKQQLMTRCPDLRFMKYKAGSEATFTRHSYEDLWYNLEAVSLEEMELEPDVLIYSLARMLNLNKLNLSNMTVLTDNLLQPSPSLPAMPPVRTLKIADAPSIGLNGLFAYVSRPDVAENLSTLQLENTALQMHDIHMILGAAYRLRNFSFRAKVSHASQTSHIPPLASTSLRQIFFEISNEHTHTGTGSIPCDSYYEYLATSIASRTLPALRSVRTFCPHFPDLLVSLAPLISTPYAGIEANSPGLSPSTQKSPNSRPSNLPPRLSAMPGTLAPPPLVSPGLSPSMANRMSAMSLGSGSDPSSPGSVASHARSQSHIPPQHSGPRLSPGVAQRPSSSYGIGYSQTPFSPSLSELRHASAAEPPVPHDIVSRLGLVGGGLTIYTKPPNAEEMEWLVTELVPPSTGVGGRGATSGGIRGARPISLMPSAAGGQAQDLDLSWLSDGPSGKVSQTGLVGSHGGQLVGNGFGGYVEVKEEGKKGRRKGADWMG